MDFRTAGPLRVHVTADATLPDPGRFPRILRIAHEIWQAGTGPATRIDDVDRFVLVCGGQGVFGHEADVARSAGAAPPREASVSAGAVVLTAAGERVRLCASGDENLTLYIVTARTPGFRRRLASERGAGTAVVDLRSFGETETLLAGCLDHAAGGDEFCHRTALAYFATFLALLSEELSAPAATGGTREQTYQRARELIAANALEIASVASAAERLGMSADYANRLFRQYAGETVGGFLRRQRMGRAADWLRDQRLPVAAVAERLGYSDRFSFSKAFTSHFGVSPGQWRRT